jgi:hypothetical protein
MIGMHLTNLIYISLEAHLGISVNNFTDVGFLSSLSWLLYIYKLEFIFCSCVR